MRVPAVVLLVLGSAHLVCAETNSLSLLVTFIIGETPFPELTGVLMVNDIPVEYGDLKKVVSRRHWRPNDTIQESHLRDFVVAEAYAEMKSASLTMMKHFNHTEGVHVYQAFVACDLEDDKLSRFFITKAYDGDENYQYDMISHTQNTTVPEFMWGKLQKEAAKMVYTNIHQPLCVRTLRRYLREDKNILLRKGAVLFVTGCCLTGSDVCDPPERPRVRVTQRTEAHSGRTQVSCLATGFYPRCINVTLLRDGRPVPDQELTGGQVLPNGDGTYQLRRSLSVSEEELRQRHLYTCTVSHLSVDNRLDVNIGENLLTCTVSHLSADSRLDTCTVREL
ncbi:major histocompatibility complex class I-related gene protein-like isoform X2 [Arapaima gigas]